MIGTKKQLSGSRWSNTTRGVSRGAADIRPICEHFIRRLKDKRPNAKEVLLCRLLLTELKKIKENGTPSDLVIFSCTINFVLSEKYDSDFIKSLREMAESIRKKLADVGLPKDFLKKKESPFFHAFIARLEAFPEGAMKPWAEAFANKVEQQSNPSSTHSGTEDGRSLLEIRLGDSKPQEIRDWLIRIGVLAKHDAFEREKFLRVAKAYLLNKYYKLDQKDCAILLAVSEHPFLDRVCANYLRHHLRKQLPVVKDGKTPRSRSYLYMAGSGFLYEKEATSKFWHEIKRLAARSEGNKLAYQRLEKLLVCYFKVVKKEDGANEEDLQRLSQLFCDPMLPKKSKEVIYKYLREGFPSIGRRRQFSILLDIVNASKSRGNVLVGRVRELMAGVKDSKGEGAHISKEFSYLPKRFSSTLDTKLSKTHRVGLLGYLHLVSSAGLAMLLVQQVFIASQLNWVWIAGSFLSTLALWGVEKCRQAWVRRCADKLIKDLNEDFPEVCEGQESSPGEKHTAVEENTDHLSVQEKASLDEVRINQFIARLQSRLSLIHAVTDHDFTPGSRLQTKLPLVRGLFTVLSVFVPGLSIGVSFYAADRRKKRMASHGRVLSCHRVQFDKFALALVVCFYKRFLQSPDNNKPEKEDDFSKQLVEQVLEVLAEIGENVTSPDFYQKNPMQLACAVAEGVCDREEGVDKPSRQGKESEGCATSFVYSNAKILELGENYELIKFFPSLGLKALKDELKGLRGEVAESKLSKSVEGHQPCHQIEGELGEAENEINLLQDSSSQLEIERLRRVIDGLHQRLTSYISEMSSLKEEVKEQKENVSILAQVVKGLVGLFKNLSSDVNEANEKIEALEKKVASLEKKEAERDQVIRELQEAFKAQFPQVVADISQGDAYQDSSPTIGQALH